MKYYVQAVQRVTMRVFVLLLISPRARFIAIAFSNAKKQKKTVAYLIGNFLN